MIFQNLLIRRLSLALAFLVISCTSVLADNLPPVLLADAEKHGCEEAADFYDKAVFAAPFVYGYGDESDGRKKFFSEEDTAVYWCRAKDKQKYKNHYLIVYSQHQKPNGCPKKVIETSIYPGGLSLFQDKQFFQDVRLNFSDFTFVETWGETWESVPEVDVDGLTGQFIMSAKSGSAGIFYCYQGKWVGIYLH